MKTAKKVTERSKPLPYERDSVWEPNQDDVRSCLFQAKVID